MSEARGSRIARRSTDFSIARILAVENPRGGVDATAFEAARRRLVVEPIASLRGCEIDRQGSVASRKRQRHAASYTRAGLDASDFREKINEGSGEESRERRVGIAAPPHPADEVAYRARGYDDSEKRNDDKNDNDETVRRADLTWLHYTRYRPPKLPRRSCVERRIKRRAGDRPRIPFSSSQLQVLEDKYSRGAYLSRNDVVEISATLRLPQNKVKIWFQNRRARQRRELSNSTVAGRDCTIKM